MADPACDELSRVVIRPTCYLNSSKKLTNSFRLSREGGCVIILLCHCEPFEFLRVNSPKGAWQSHYFHGIMRLPLGHELEAEWLRSLHSLAITLRHRLEGGNPCESKDLDGRNNGKGN
jgi:hypothetical protein